MQMHAVYKIVVWLKWRPCRTLFRKLIGYTFIFIQTRYLKDWKMESKAATLWSKYYTSEGRSRQKDKLQCWLCSIFSSSYNAFYWRKISFWPYWLVSRVWQVFVIDSFICLFNLFLSLLVYCLCIFKVYFTMQKKRQVAPFYTRTLSRSSLDPVPPLRPPAPSSTSLTFTGASTRSTPTSPRSKSPTLSALTFSWPLSATCTTRGWPREAECMMWYPVEKRPSWAFRWVGADLHRSVHACITRSERLHICFSSMDFFPPWEFQVACFP